MNKSKVMTNNHFMDNLVHVLKSLSIGCILKDEKLADSMETLNSMRNSAIYIACIENKSSLDMFNEIPDIVLSESLVPQYIKDNPFAIRNTQVDKEYNKILLNNMNQHFIDTYVEENNYYRKLDGHPDFNDPGLYLDSPVGGIDSSKYIHDMSNGEIDILDRRGILKSLKDKYPDKEYLNHLGDKSISVYKTRRAAPFEMIYCPNVGTRDEQTRFTKAMEKNRTYTVKTIYSDAYAIGSDYYDNFISVLIIVQTVSDLLIDAPDLIIRREFYDETTIQNIFKSHGITYFPDIPLRYQVAMIKNLNTLLKFKSTTKNLVDICSIFGFDNIELFKYYLLKDRKVNPDGTYTDPVYIRDDKGNLSEDDTVNYDLKFIKIPIEGIADDYIRDVTHHMSYKDVVDTDKYWYGNSPTKEIDDKILNNHFNYVISKYLSLDTIYDMSEMSFDMTYFINMIFDNRKLEENLNLFIPLLSPSHKFKLVDTICFLYVLMYEMIGIDDTILDTSSKVLHVLGFNFDADISAIATDIANKGYTSEELGIDINDFQIPKSEILSYNELINIYQNNKELRTTLMNLITRTDDINMYRVYNQIYEALMVSDLNTGNFTTKDGMFANTYTKFLRDRDEVIYKTILDVRKLDTTDKIGRANEIMEAIITSLEEYVVSVDFDFFISNISTISTELAQRYLYKMINFFKSHTVQMLSMNIIYSFNNTFDNKVFIFDEIERINAVFDLITPYRHNIVTDRVFFPNHREIKIITDMPIHDSISIFKTYN